MTEQECRKNAAKYFQCQLPIQRNALKSMYRTACKGLHTDVSGRDSASEFIQMKALYDFLSADNAPEWAVTDGVVTDKAADGTPLSVLGLGLGPTKNSKPCSSCKGAGYTVEVFDESSARCHCLAWLFKATRPMEGRCGRCGGSGRYQRNGRDVGPCNGCAGKGHRLNVRCRICNDTGYVTEKAKKLYYVCWTCKGTGEIELNNPVIRKGVLTGVT